MKEKNPLRFDQTLSQERRSQTGSYYTPPKVAKFMVCLSLSQLLSQNSNLDFEAYFKVFHHALRVSKEQADQILDQLLSFKILDLSAGSGIFALTYLEVISHFLESNEWIFARYEKKKLLTELIHHFAVMDIQKEPLELYRQELTQTYGVDSSQSPIYDLDALTEMAELPMTLQEFLSGGVDLVLGNPPYLGEKNHKELFQRLRLTHFGSRYYEGRMDYFYYFVYKAIECLKPAGILCYITTNYFATADGAQLLRKTLKEAGNFKWLVNFNDSALFKDALGQHSAIYLYEKANSHTLTADNSDCHLYYPVHKASSWGDLVSIMGTNEPSVEWLYNRVPKDMLYDNHGLIKMIPNESHQIILDKISNIFHNNGLEVIEKRETLGDQFFVQQGIVSGFDRDFKNDNGVFVLTPEELEENPELEPFAKGFIKNKQIRRFRPLKPYQYHILYISGKDLALEEEVGPLYEHLKPYRERLANRREVVKNIRPWYALQWPREAWRFEGPLIAAPQRAFVNVFAYSEGELYGSADIYYIASKNKDASLRERTLFMSAYLNSSIIYFWLSLMGKRKGSMLELYATPLKRVPILSFDSKNAHHIEVVELTEKLIDLLSQDGDQVEKALQTRAIFTKLNQHFYELLGLTHEEARHVENYYFATGAASHENAYWGIE